MVEDRLEDAQLVLHELARAGFGPTWKRVETESDYLAALSPDLDLILADYMLPQFDGPRALALLQERGLDIPFILVSGSIGEERAVEAMKQGATDYLLKDRLGRLGQAVKSALEQRRLRDEKRRTERDLRERAQCLALSADIGEALTRRADLPDILQRCAESMVANLGAAFARIWVLNPEANVLELRASAGMYTHLDGAHSRVPVGRFKIGRIAQERKPHLTNDVLNDPQISDPVWARREGMIAFAGHPLIVDGQLIGVMALFARQPLSEFILTALRSAADTIAVGIKRKTAEEAVQESEERLRQITENTDEALWLASVEPLRTLYVSPAYEAIWGRTRQSLYERTRSWLDGVHPEDRALARQMADKRFQGEWAAFEYRVVRPDGSVRLVHETAFPIRDAGGRVYRIAGISRDITERRQLQDQFRQAQKMEAVGRLAGGVAHDFNNLLTIINGYSDMILDRLGSGDPLRDRIDQIRKAGDRAAALTRQLLTFSRKQVLVPETLDLGELIAEVAKMLRRLIGEDIDLKISSAPDLWPIRADPGQVEQVLMNLVVNARDAMPNGGKLTIETRNVQLDDSYVATHQQSRRGPHVLLAITDTGCGMDTATQAHIFEPFFTTKGEKGTGLGLATVYGIVKQSGGHIEVYSEPGRGTTFKVYLPRDQQAGTAKPASRVIQPARGTETVLVVEDEEGVRNLARLALASFGYTVLMAEGGVEAIGMVERHPGPVHLLLTDLIMPGLNGRETAERLLALRPNLKVLYVSGYTDEAILHHGVLEPGMAFLHKPFGPASLARKVREVLDGVSGSRG
jgi:PAS domain S-box-containing protein